MAEQLIRRKGTTLEHESFTGADGEITIDTDLNTVRVHDGTGTKDPVTGVITVTQGTPGGHRLAKHDELVLKSDITTTDLRATAMSKATFNAIARDNRDRYAGSGFVDKGNTVTPTNNELVSINDSGLATAGLASYVPNLSGDNEDKFALMSTVENINGFVIKTGMDSVYHNSNYGLSVFGTNAADVNGAFGSVIQLPPAPTIYAHDTTDAQELHLINEGLAVQHADSSNSGLIINGKFDANTDGWKSRASSAGVTFSSGKARLTSSATDGNGYWFEQIVKPDGLDGKKYILEFDLDFGTSTGSRHIRIRNGGLFGADVYTNSSPINGRNQVEFTNIGTDIEIFIGFGGNIGEYIEIDNIAVFPKDAISRTDLAFLESWHEDTAEKGVLYDLGNVQYKGTISAGTAGSFSGQDTYSLLGNWQQTDDLVGKAISIASLSFAQLMTFVGNPENNCYYDGDKLIQVRYRIRTVSGWGDEWSQVDSQVLNSFTMMYSDFNINSIKPKGKLTSIFEDTGDRYLPTSGLGGAYYNQRIIDNPTTIENGVFEATGGTITSSAVAYAHEGKCYALPIATVHRRNQGAYHPVFNANGSSYQKNETADTGGVWHTSLASTFKSTMECFRFKGFGAAMNNDGGWAYSTDQIPGGNIEVGHKGRPDGLFYDQIAEGDITDLRMSAHDTSDLEVMNSVFNNAISGVERGSEGEWEVILASSGTLDTVSVSAYTGVDSSRLEFYSENLFREVKVASALSDHYGNSNDRLNDDVIFYVKGDSQWYTGYAGWYNGTSSYINLMPEHGDISTDFTIGVTYEILVTKQSSRVKSNTILHCDIIGDPANYPQEWKDNGVFGTPLLVGENGEDYIPDGTSKAIKLSKKVDTEVLQIHSVDNGVSWATGAYGIDSTSNSVTASFPLNGLRMFFYTTHTNMAEPTVNSAVRNGVIGDAMFTQYSLASSGVNLASTLINKVPVSASVGSKANGYKIEGFTFDEANNRELFANAAWYPSHTVLTPPNNTSTTVKLFPYLTTENGRKVVNLVFKEMKYDVDWGDDSKFNIVNNVSTTLTLDDNGNTVLIGQKKIVTPYFAKDK